MESLNINNYLNKLFILFILSFSVNAQAEEVVCLPEIININEGDVISADVLNEILTRINNIQTGGMTTSDLLGKWQCTSTTIDLEEPQDLIMGIHRIHLAYTR